MTKNRSKNRNYASPRYPTGEPRIAGDDTITVPSERSVKARASLQKATPAAPPAEQGQGQEPIEKRVWSIALDHPMTKKEIQDVLGLAKHQVQTAVTDLVAAGLMRGEGTIGKGPSKAVAFISQGLWTPQARQVKGRMPAAPPARCDALSRISSPGVSISEDVLPAYKEAFERVSRMHYGIEEIDDVLDQFASALRGRISSVRRPCPLCGRTLDIEVAKVSCSKCGITIDSPSLEASLRMLAHCKGE